jgi:hypothetical protein
LVGDVYDSETSKQIWTCLIMRIYDHEKDLDRGRFENFKRETREFTVSFKLTNQSQPWATLIGPMINWIAEIGNQPWSLDIDILHVGEGRFDFSFDELDVATMFKLVFA